MHVCSRQYPFLQFWYCIRKLANCCYHIFAVSSQAIYFGVAGLVTGSVIGLCIGYSVRKGSSQMFSTSFSTTPMRAILTTNVGRRVDVSS